MMLTNNTVAAEGVFLGLHKYDDLLEKAKKEEVYI